MYRRLSHRVQQTEVRLLHFSSRCTLLMSCITVRITFPQVLYKYIRVIASSGLSPNNVSSVSTTNLTPRRDVSSDIVKRWSKQPGRLPLLTELRDLLDQPLPEDEKVPLPREVFEQFQSLDLHDPCSRDDVEILFRESESEPSVFLVSLFLVIA